MRLEFLDFNLRKSALKISVICGKMYLYLNRRSKLLQKPYVILREQPQVIHPVFQHGRSFDPHTKGEARVFIRINAAVAQYIGMHHATAEDLHPTGFLTDITAAAAADKTGHIHFGAGLGEGEIGGTETDFHILAVHLFYEEV